MGYCLSVYLDDLDKLQRWLNSGDQEVSEVAGVEPAVVAGLKRVLNGEDVSDFDAASLIKAFGALCSRCCTRLGELDHFRYEEEDFPELWNFQWGDSSTSMNIPIADDGLPAMGHWPVTDIATLLQEVKSIDSTERPDYVAQPILTGKDSWSTPIKELERWLTEASKNNKGLIHFYE
jgi:hypothetical protein